MPKIMTITTTPFADQRPGTSGLRKTVKTFQQTHYLENFVQAIFNTLPTLSGGCLVIGGDGRFYNDTAIQIILKIAAANGVARALVGQNGILSTPAISNLIRKHAAIGGIILSASHNPGGETGDFGIKYNTSNGGPAPQSVTEAIFANTKTLQTYMHLNADDIDLAQKGETQMGDMAIEIIDSVADYAAQMAELFDFPAIKALFGQGLTMCFDAMHAVTGPYARALFDELGAAENSVVNADPLPDFGGGHPDPNPVYTKTLFDTMFAKDGPDFGAASDGDGDRNIVLGKGLYVSPSDSLAILAANAHLIPAYASGLKGVARSMPTSQAVDRVADALGIPCFETPTGWKFFGNLLDSGQITLCGEESAGASSNHIREKDGLWAVLMWLNIVAARKQSVGEIVRNHWKIYGRNYYSRHDYEGVELMKAQTIIRTLSDKLSTLPGTEINGMRIARADNFTYQDPVDNMVAKNQGLCVAFEDSSRFVMRLSGTGTIGATIRLYLEKYEPAGGDMEQDVQNVLAKIADIADTLSGLKAHSSMAEPTAIS